VAQLVVQKAGTTEINWIIETKGRVWEGTTAKDEAIHAWCQRISAATGRTWRYARINQTDFNRAKASALEELLA
jgi:type III restriction enzyme